MKPKFKAGQEIYFLYNKSIYKGKIKGKEYVSLSGYSDDVLVYSITEAIDLFSGEKIDISIAQGNLNGLWIEEQDISRDRNLLKRNEINYYKRMVKYYNERIKEFSSYANDYNSSINKLKFIE